MRDVLLITVDALRADRIGRYGYDRETTPQLDDLAADATVYEDATAHGPTTFSSFPSILTGRHAYSTDGYPALSGRTIAECFAEAGYHTASITSNAWVSPTYEYDKGFEETHALGRGPRFATGPLDRFRHWMGDRLGDGYLYGAAKRVYDTVRDVSSESVPTEQRIHDLVTEHLSRSEPTFTWSHYMTTHAPYTPDTDRGSRFVEEPRSDDAHSELIEVARHRPEDLSEAERRSISDRYDESVAHVDRRIGELLDDVDPESTVVCITADHGEALFERGYFEHPPRLDRELLHVPLVVLGPGTDDRTVSVPVGTESLPATLAHLAGIDAGSVAGEPLPPWGGRPTAVCAAVAHADRFEPELVSRAALRLAARTEQWKLVVDPDGTADLYARDSTDGDRYPSPGERRDGVTEDHSADRPEVCERLKQHAESYAADFQFGETREIPPEIEDHLSELGYVE